MGFTVFSVNITHVDSRTQRTCGISSNYVVYVIRVQHGGQAWILEKRYSDFVTFEQELRSRFWYMEIPKLPPKKFFFTYDAEFLESRRKELESFMQALLKTSCWSQSEAMWNFLTDKNSVVGVPHENGGVSQGYSDAQKNISAVQRRIQTQA